MAQAHGWESSSAGSDNQDMVAAHHDWELSEGDEAEDEPGEDESGGEGADDVLGEPADEFLNLLLNR